MSACGIAQTNTKSCGSYFPLYQPCGDCGMPKGYPKDYCVELCVEVNGEKMLYIAKSNVAENTSEPAFDNSDWTIKTLCGWLASGGSGTAIIPEIGENGNWYINGVDTKRPSKGADGSDGSDGGSGSGSVSNLTDNGVGDDYRHTYTHDDGEGNIQDIVLCPTFISDFNGAHDVINASGPGTGGGGGPLLSWTPTNQVSAPVTYNGDGTFNVDADGWMKINFTYAGYISMEATTGDGRKEDGDIRMYNISVQLNEDDNHLAITEEILQLSDSASWQWGIRNQVATRWVKVSAGDTLKLSLGYGHAKILANDPQWTVGNFEFRACLNANE